MSDKIKNRVKFGLRNCHYAKATLGEDGKVTFGTPVAMPGAVSLSLDAEGDNDPFYADDTVYYMVSNNNGYSGDLEIALIPESFLTDILKEGKTAEEMLRGILAPLDPVVTDTTDCSFYCSCSRERVSRALMTVGEKELRSMISDGKPVELSCHFCGKSYTFSVKDLERMLKTGGAS